MPRDNRLRSLVHHAVATGNPPSAEEIGDLGLRPEDRHRLKKAFSSLASSGHERAEGGQAILATFEDRVPPIDDPDEPAADILDRIPRV